MSDFRNRLEQFLRLHSVSKSIETLTPDASTREYFRVEWAGRPAIACVYPEAFDLAEQSYIDVTELFLKADLPVARILQVDETLGVIVIEDFGDRILRDVLAHSDAATRERLLDSAIRLIAKIQAATDLAFDLDSVASRLRFDQGKLKWELEFFFEHYFTTFRQRQLDEATALAVNAEFADLASILQSRATVLCHRDFHSANLMVAGDDSLRIIDHQDARIGSAAYDLVSLLLDRVTEPPTADWLADRRRYFLAERRSLGLAEIDEQEFADEFRLQTVQRCLKAVGTFSYQAANRGKVHFIDYIDPMFRIVLRALDHLDQFPVLRNVLDAEIVRTHE